MPNIMRVKVDETLDLDTEPDSQGSFFGQKDNVKVVIRLRPHNERETSKFKLPFDHLYRFWRC
jgi:translation initiation factor IF-3